MKTWRFTCKQCGACCIKLDGYETTCTTRDVRRWERQGRYDILAWVETWAASQKRLVHDIWINPRTGNPVTRCPWLRKVARTNRYRCLIHDTKPERCRNWCPDSTAHAAEIGCRGWEESTSYHSG